MNGAELLKGVDFVSRERNISKEVIFSSIEKAVRLAIQKCYDDEDGIAVTIDRQSGVMQALKGEKELATEELGRIPAQAAKQVLIQNFREEESNAVFNEFDAKKGELVHGTVGGSRAAPPRSASARPKCLLPRGEQIPGETHHVGERVKAVILEVKRSAIASASSCRGPIPISFAACSRMKFPKSATARSRSRPWPARPAIAQKWPFPARYESGLRRRLRRRSRQPHQEHRG